MADLIPVQFNRIEAPIDIIRSEGHSGLMAFAPDIDYLVYQQGPSLIEHLYPDSGQVTTIILNATGIITQDISTLSGYLQIEINNLNTASGSIKTELYNTSGTLRNDITDLQTASGYLNNLITELNTTSGYIANQILELQIASGNFDLASGHLHSEIEALQITSGYLQTQIIDLQISSGDIKTIIENTSGYLQQEIDNLNLSSGNAVDLSIISGNIIALQTTSGYLQQEITDLQTASGSIKTELYNASGTIIDYINVISGVLSSGMSSAFDIGPYSGYVESTYAKLTDLDNASGTIITYINNASGTLRNDITDLQTSSGYLNIQITNLNISSGYINEKITALDTTSGFIASQITDLQTASGLHDISIINLKIASGLFDIASGHMHEEINALQVTSGYLQYEITNLNLSSGTSSIDLSIISGNIIALQITSGYLQTEIDNLNISSGYLNEQIIALNTSSGYIDTQIINLNTASGYLNEKIIALEITSGYINNQLLVISGDLSNSSGILRNEITILQTKVDNLNIASGIHDIEINELQTATGVINDEFRLASGTLSSGCLSTIYNTSGHIISVVDTNLYNASGTIISYIDNLSGILHDEISAGYDIAPYSGYVNATFATQISLFNASGVLKSEINALQISSGIWKEITDIAVSPNSIALYSGHIIGSGLNIRGNIVSSGNIICSGNLGISGLIQVDKGIIQNNTGTGSRISTWAHDTSGPYITVPTSDEFSIRDISNGNIISLANNLISTSGVLQHKGIIVSSGQITSSGNLGVSGIATIADATIGYEAPGGNPRIYLSNSAVQTSNDRAITQDSNGKTIVGSSTGQSLGLAIGGTNKITINNNGTTVLSDSTQIANDTDVINTLGRTSIGGIADVAFVSHIDNATASNCALSQNAAGMTQINSKSNQTCNLAIAGTNKLTVNVDGTVTTTEEVGIMGAAAAGVGLNIVTAATEGNQAWSLGFSTGAGDTDFSVFGKENIVAGTPTVVCGSAGIGNMVHIIGKRSSSTSHRWMDIVLFASGSSTAVVVIAQMTLLGTAPSTRTYTLVSGQLLLNHDNANNQDTVAYSRGYGLTKF